MAKNTSPNCCEQFKTVIGGQALIEGIMMRGPEKDAVVVRGKDGVSIEVNRRKIPQDKSPLRWPLIRGVYNFFDAQVTGVKSLMHSADLAPDEETVKEKRILFFFLMQEKLGVLDCMRLSSDDCSEILEMIGEVLQEAIEKK